MVYNFVRSRLSIRAYTSQLLRDGINREVVPTLRELVARWNALNLEDSASELTFVAATGNLTSSPFSFIDYGSPVTASYTVTLHDPAQGDIVYVKAPPNATRYPLTISGNGKNIDGQYTGATSFSLDANDMAIGLFYNGTRWRVF